MNAELLKTPLWAEHVALGARMVEFGGWHMPVQYDGILAEHHRTRTEATVFDTCHMGRLLVSGPGSPDALAGLVTVDVRAMADGQCRYGFLLREDSGILDDLIVYRLRAERWMVVVNAGTLPRDREWMRARIPVPVAVEDVSGRVAKLDVQGPCALALAGAALGADLGSIGRFRFRTVEYEGSETWVSRTGYTGEDGVEIYPAAGQVVGLWRRLLQAGVGPAGLGARDTLRLEAGLPLYGHELSEDVTPVEAGLERYARKAEPFVGRDAVLRRLADGPAQRLIGFRVAGRQTARAAAAVVATGRTVGRVTSGSFSPTLGCAIGFAYVQTALAAPGARVQVDGGRGLLDAELAAAPLYRRTGGS
jgi:aminomethyltransferase